MKRTFPFRLLMAFALLLGLKACGLEVVELDLPEGRPRLVVEGGITNLPPPHSIYLSWSSSLQKKSPLAEEEALLILSDDEGREDTLLHQQNGEYHSMLTGIPDRTYFLRIILDTATIEALAYMPPPALADSFSIRYLAKSTFREEGYYVRLHNLDPQETEGYYRFMVWQNGRLQKSNGINGHFITFSINQNNQPLDLQYPSSFQKGDSLMFQTIKMDKAVYTYYQGLIELMMNDGGLLGPLPTNPAGNLSGGALGVFQANSIRETPVLIE